MRLDRRAIFRLERLLPGLAGPGRAFRMTQMLLVLDALVGEPVPYRAVEVRQDAAAVGDLRLAALCRRRLAEEEQPLRPPARIGHFIVQPDFDMRWELCRRVDIVGNADARRIATDIGAEFGPDGDGYFSKFQNGLHAEPAEQDASGAVQPGVQLRPVSSGLVRERRGRVPSAAPDDERQRTSFDKRSGIHVCRQR